MPQPAQSPPRCTKCSGTHQRPLYQSLYCCIMVHCSAVFMCLLMFRALKSFRRYFRYRAVARQTLAISVLHRDLVSGHPSPGHHKSVTASVTIFIVPLACSYSGAGDADAAELMLCMALACMRSAFTLDVADRGVR